MWDSKMLPPHLSSLGKRGIGPFFLRPSFFSGVSYSSHSLHSSGQVGKQAYHVLSREPPYLHEDGVRLRNHSLPQTTSHRA